MTMSPLFFIFLFLLSEPRRVRAQVCPVGTYTNGSACTPCPLGTYNPTPGIRGIDLCLPCPPRTFNPTSRATSISKCRKCAPGKASNYGASKCISCKAGTFITRDQTPTCQRCPRGKFSATGNRLFCVPCPEGTVAHREGESKCRMCGVGRGSGNGISCFPCNSRSFNDGTFSECVRCPPGFESDSIRGASACVPCKRGFGLGRAGNACSKCKKGENVPNPRPRCIQGGTPCPSGFFETSDGVCRRCRIGERFDSRLEICVKCPPNKVSTGGLDEECRRCTFDRRSDSVFGCVCNDGFETLPSGECRICPAGTRYERSSSDAPLGACVKCPPGTYAGGEGMRFCKRCPQGYVQPKTGQKACVKCPNGLIASNLEREEYPFTLDRAYGDGERFSVSRGLLSAEDGAIFARSECVDKKTNCPGRSRRIVDQKGRFYCEPRSCPRNSFEATVGASGFSKKVKICLSCESGRFLDKKRATCVQCTQGRRSGGGVQESCTSCPGLTQSTHDFSAVEECACYSGNVTTGFLSLRRDVGAVGIVDGKCRECPRGTFGTLRSAVCVKCPKGQVQTNVGQFECSFCESGFFSDVEGATRCKKCPDGTTTYGLGDAECVQIGGQA